MLISSVNVLSGRSIRFVDCRCWVYIAAGFPDGGVNINEYIDLTRLSIDSLQTALACTGERTADLQSQTVSARWSPPVAFGFSLATCITRLSDAFSFRKSRYL